MEQVVAVILAGGSGTRLWPLSRMNSPKQFLPIGGSGKSMLEETVARLNPIIAPEFVTVVTSEALARGEAHAALQNYQKILEPCGRNTAPAIGIASVRHLTQGQDPVMVVLPADHMIQDVEAFHVCLSAAIEHARAGELVTFGIKPSAPETGFGYIHAPGAGDATRAALAFKEKPDAETAAQFIAQGGFYWNSGMFVWKASTILAAIARHLPELHAVLEAIAAETKLGTSFDAAVKTHFAAAPSISIDHGVLEKLSVSAEGGHAPTSKLLVVPADIGWSDVGSWDAVYDVADKDHDGNSATGNAIAIDCRNTMISSQKRVVAAVGLDDICIIETADAVLVSKRGESQKVKHVVDQLTKAGGEVHQNHLTVRRPWGSYTLLEEGDGFKIKRIEVVPGGRLSLQSHRHRSEHWVVIAGIATVTSAERVFELHPNESTFIPMGAKHRLENHATEVVQIIEVQVGSYVGEDDIQRYDDIYGRAAAVEEKQTT